MSDQRPFKWNDSTSSQCMDVCDSLTRIADENNINLFIISDADVADVCDELGLDISQLTVAQAQKFKDAYADSIIEHAMNMRRFIFMTCVEKSSQ
jgi:hypothetical protein